jgi:WD40 repeat protein
MLAAHGDWERLWRLVFEVPFEWSVRAMMALTISGWTPTQPDEQPAFATLASLATDELAAAVEQACALLPPAIRRATARVPGRVNDLAFLPDHPAIVVGTGAGRLVVWNFQQARQEQAYGGFDHSIGHVTALPGIVLGAERTTAQEPCALLGWHGGTGFRLGEHASSVTALEPVGTTRLLTAARDHTVRLWNLEAGRLEQEQHLADWVRAARVAADGQQALLLHDGMTLVALPSFDIIARTTGSGWRGVGRRAVFAPDAGALIVGRHHGQVVICRRHDGMLKPDETLVQHNTAIQGVELLAAPAVVVTASTDGHIAFTAWADRAARGTLAITGERLTSLHVSPDGAFMAVGDADASLSLWDLRVLEISDLLRRPFAQALPRHLVALATVKDAGVSSPQLDNTIQYVECVLRHRHRYAISIIDAPTIQAGEFDIEIEG